MMTAAERKEAWKGRRAWMWLALFGYAMNLFLPGFWIWGAICTVLFALCFLPEKVGQTVIEPDPEALYQKMRSDKQKATEAALKEWERRFVEALPWEDRRPQKGINRGTWHEVNPNFYYDERGRSRDYFEREALDKAYYARKAQR